MVQTYAANLRAGGPLGRVFPGPMSECEFSEEQREVIRQARADRRALQGNAQMEGLVWEAQEDDKVPSAIPLISATTQKPKGLSKLQRMLYLQSGLCFFCREPLKEEEASIEHLNPKARGGTSTTDNEVVCHSSLNEAFGCMDLKEKFDFVLKSAGSFKCPKG